jgi:hypothetical protein
MAKTSKDDNVAFSSDLGAHRPHKPVNPGERSGLARRTSTRVTPAGQLLVLGSKLSPTRVFTDRANSTFQWRPEILSAILATTDVWPFRNCSRWSA